MNRHDAFSFDHSQFITIYLGKKENNFFARAIPGKFDNEQNEQLIHMGHTMTAYREIDLNVYPVIHLAICCLVSCQSAYAVSRFLGAIVISGSEYVANHYERIFLDGGIVKHAALRKIPAWKPDDYEDDMMLTLLQCAYPEQTNSVVHILSRIGCEIYHHLPYEELVYLPRN